MIPPLTDNGVLPVGKHTATLEEIERVFATTEYRKYLWQNFLNWLTEIQQRISITRIWLGGSYFTNKKNPEDVDVVYLLHTPSKTEHQSFMKLSTLTDARNGNTYIGRVQPSNGRVDAFFVFEEQDVRKQNWTYNWSGIFQGKTRVGDKGYLEVIL